MKSLFIHLSLVAIMSFGCNFMPEKSSSGVSTGNSLGTSTGTEAPVPTATTIPTAIPTNAPTAIPTPVTAGVAYYFSSSTGDDSRTSAQAKNPATPWKTIAKLNSIFSSINPGESVLFKRGDVFIGAITISKSGTASSPVTIGAYGTGANPVISGFTNVTAWTNLGKNIWESTNTVSTLPTVNMVTINGVNTAMGRYPNTGHLTIQSFTGNTSISSSSLSVITNWTGAEVVIRKNAWIYERGKISGQVGPTLTYSDEALYIPETGFGFFIQNDSRTLDVQNEWYYNPSTKKIQVYSLAVPANVQVASIDMLVNIDSKNHITIDNITFTGANNSAIKIISSNYITIKNCDISYSGINGITVSWSNYTDITKNSIKNCNDVGIHSGGHSTNATITSNILDSVALHPGMTQRYSSGSIITYAVNSLIQYNRITNSGYNGIIIAGDFTQIRNNFINNSCLTRDDGGGIYTGGPRTSVIIDGNIILNSFGNYDGTPRNASMAEGIYLDVYSSNITITNNTIANGRHDGILVSRGHDNIIENNTSFNNAVGIDFGNWTDVTTIYNNVMNNNIFVAKEPAQLVMRHRSFINDTQNFGTANNNYYARPIDDNKTIYIGQPSEYTGTNYSKNLAEWKSFSNQDVNSNKSPISITNTNDLRFEYNATNANTTISLDAKYVDVKGVTYTGSITLLPYTSIVLIKTGTQ